MAIISKLVQNHNIKFLIKNCCILINVLKIFLKLYVSGDNLRSRRAISNLREFCVQKLSQETQIEIIDVAQYPEIAEAERILITPTLIRESPEPKERIIGDLSNTEVLAFVLNLTSKPNKNS